MRDENTRSASVQVRLEHRLAKIKFLNDTETRRLFAVISSKRDRAMFLIAYRHGLRASEVGLLQLADLDFNNLHIMIRRTNRSHSGEHPLQLDERRALKSYLDSRDRTSLVLFLSVRGDPISRRGLDWLMKNYGKVAKLPRDKQHFHVLKHSIATHLLDAGAGLRFVHDWLGHSNLQSTAIYTFLISGRKRGTPLAKLFPRLIP